MKRKAPRDVQYILVRETMATVYEQLGTEGDEVLQARDAIYDALEKEGQRGQRWATIALKRFAIERIHELYASWLKAETSRVKLPSGMVVSVPARLAVPGGPRGRYRRWWTLPWADFELLVNDLHSKGTRLSIEAQALTEVAKLRGQFPETETVEEACTLAGKDPKAFGITGTDAK